MRLSLYGVLAAAVVGPSCVNLPSEVAHAQKTAACATNYEFNSSSRLVGLLMQIPLGTTKQDRGNGEINYHSSHEQRPKMARGNAAHLSPAFEVEIGNIAYTQKVNGRLLSIEATFKYSTGRKEKVLLCESTNAKRNHSEKEENMHSLGFREAEITLLYALHSLPPIKAPPPSPGFAIALTRK